MTWKSIHRNIPHGFAGNMKPGVYVIGDIQLLRSDAELNDGIYEDGENQIAVLTLSTGYFKVYTSTKVMRYTVEKKIVLMPVDLSILSPDSPDISFVFASSSNMNVHASDINGIMHIKGQEHIIAEFEEDEDDEENSI